MKMLTVFSVLMALVFVAGAREMTQMADPSGSGTNGWDSDSSAVGACVHADETVTALNFTNAQIHAVIREFASEGRGSSARLYLFSEKAPETPIAVPVSFEAGKTMTINIPPRSKVVAISRSASGGRENVHLTSGWNSRFSWDHISCVFDGSRVRFLDTPSTRKETLGVLMRR